ncbi:glycosyltransferase family 2 protein [Desulfonatronum thioautotrophicum]|uniref:glycosyltransferase family 2 protein n=1 Tax=Desulfonatronum thioautotrophicum TaxID=617001 RepID=UPI00069C0037|nr:glycosyltransferase family 2 protein [Desulfonatronum thioautotrophicum]
MRDQHNDTICLNSDYSTTRLVTREKPVIVNKPEDTFETVLFLPEGENRTGQGGLRTQGLFKRSLPDKPLITVITVVLNGAKHLEETILSVLNQTYDNVEYIVIDGGSTDWSLDIIRKYENGIDYWVSEKDKGIYDAMNKGVTTSTGQFISTLNSDDFFFTYALEHISLASNNFKNKIHVYTGDIIRVDEKSKYLFTVSKGNPNVFKILFRMPINHPAFFLSLVEYKKNGLYDYNYKISADYEYLLRLYFNKSLKIYNINKPLTNVRIQGISEKKGAYLIRAKENFDARSKYIPYHINIFFYTLYVALYSIKSSSKSWK